MSNTNRLSEEFFLAEYDKLNAAQKEAVDTIEGPVMVVAGPGTGKTQILTLRIANILRLSQVNPRNILALTYTHAAATNMISRLHRLIGPPAWEVEINTFHGFCQYLISEFADEFAQFQNFSVIADVDASLLIEKILDETKPKLLRNPKNPHMFVPDILSCVRTLKQEGFDVAEFTQLVKDAKSQFDEIPDKISDNKARNGKLKVKYLPLQKTLDKNTELISIYAKYQDALSQAKKIDFSDLITAVISELKNNDEFRATLRERFQYILVDEHQDSNGAQNKILDLIAEDDESPNLFVVGDDKQAIFRFQGAQSGNFTHFKSRYPSSTLITLIQNYRSPQSLLDTAIQLLNSQKSDQDTLHTPLESQSNSSHQAIDLATFSKSSSEKAYVAKMIKDLLKSGVAKNDIAVISKKNAPLKNLATFLNEEDITTRLSTQTDIFETEEIALLLIVFQAVVNFGEYSSLQKLVVAPFSPIDALDAYRFCQLANQSGNDAYRLIGDVDQLNSANLSDISISKLQQMYSNLQNWQKLSKTTPLVQMLRILYTESGLQEFLLKSPNPLLAISPIRSLFEALTELDEIDKKRLSDLDFIITQKQKHHLKIPFDMPSDTNNSILLTTAHSSKGLEFEYVFIFDATQTHWGGKNYSNKVKLINSVYDLGENQLTTIDTDEEELELMRLFFVALTRAKNHVYITYSLADTNSANKLPFKYLDNLNPELINKINTQDFEKELENNPLFGLSMSSPNQLKIHTDLLDFVRGYFDESGISVSALNNFLECPWKYFFNNLVRIPAGVNLSTAFGNAVHFALNQSLNLYKNSGKLDEKIFINFFISSLTHQHLSKSDFEDLSKKGAEVLPIYFKAKASSWPKDTLLEFSFKNVTIPFPANYLPQSGNSLPNLIKLTGKLDMLEFLDNMHTSVKVTDFKTGKCKSRSQILKKDDVVDGANFRQLVFYRLLIESSPGIQFKFKIGCLEFIESDDDGNIKSHDFEISDEDLADLKSQLFTAVASIYNLSFWNQKCEKEDCEYCLLRPTL